jgi:hypothetical protein
MSEERAAYGADITESWGWYRVEGYRHSAIAFAKSEAEAIRKAVDAGIVHEEEDPTAYLWTVKLPEVF